jgi:hypothetical protein
MNFSFAVFSLGAGAEKLYSTFVSVYALQYFFRSSKNIFASIRATLINNSLFNFYDVILLIIISI